MNLAEVLEFLGAAACATDSGVPRCPLCGRYARHEDVGQVGHRFRAGNDVGYVTIHAHLPGRGCRAREKAAAIAAEEE